MNEIDKTNLTDQTKFRFNEISKIENYFNQEINQWILCSKKLRKYVAAFHYIDIVLIVVSATNGGVCIISSVSVVGAPAGITGASFTFGISSTDWHGNKSWRIWYDNEGEKKYKKMKENQRNVSKKQKKIWD